MKKQRAIALASAVLMVAALGTGCGGNKGGGGTADITKVNEKWADTACTLKYASWASEKVNNAMLADFTAKYPNVKAELDTTFKGDAFTGQLQQAASTGSLPDVFMLDNVPYAVQNNWIAPIDTMWNYDKTDSDHVNKALADMCLYNGKRFACPTPQYVIGIGVNKTLLAEKNIALPSYNWKIEDMVSIIKAASEPKKHIYGFISSLSGGVLNFDQYMPMQYDATLGYNTYGDDGKIHFTNEKWVEGYKWNSEFQKQGYDAAAMTQEEKLEEFGSTTSYPFNEGNVALILLPSWSMNSCKEQTENNGYEFDFYPYPGGSAGQFMPSIVDGIGVSSKTQYPEAAYYLMKWMSWGTEGFTSRLDAYEANNLLVDCFPLTDDESLMTRIKGVANPAGVSAIAELVGKAKTNIDKFVPGWTDYYSWAVDQGLYKDLNSGSRSPADVAKEMEDKANQMMAAQKEELNNIIASR